MSENYFNCWVTKKIVFIKNWPKKQHTGRKIHKNKPNLSEMHISNYNHGSWYVSCEYIKRNITKPQIKHLILYFLCKAKFVYNTHPIRLGNNNLKMGLILRK